MEHQDMEKNRLEYVAQLEEQLAHARSELATYKPIADKWLPIVNGRIDGEFGRFTLSYGGNRVTVEMSQEAMLSSDATMVTSAVTNSMCANLIADKLKEVVRPEVERVMKGFQSTSKVGQW